MLNEIQSWTRAGKGEVYTQFDPFRPGTDYKSYTKFGEMKGRIVSPVELNWLKLEAKLKEMGFTAETVAAAAAAYAEEREKTSVSRSQANLNCDLQNDGRTDAETLARELADDLKEGPKSAALKQLQQDDIKRRMEELKLQGRLLPDSSMTTYFGKPAFHSYGNGNTNPTNGGLLYGSYLKTHNINPHSGDNKPDNIQVYGAAMKNPNGFVIAKPSKSPQKETTTGKKDEKKKSENRMMTATTQAERFTRRPEPPRQSRTKRPITAAMLKTSDKQFPVEPEACNPTNYRAIKKPKL